MGLALKGLRSDLCEYCDAQIVVKGTITIEATDDTNKRNKSLNFKNIAPFRSCISKFHNTFIDNTEDLDIFMSIYNLLEYSGDYSITSGSFWNCYRDEVNDAANENDVVNNEINSNKAITSKVRA